MKNTQSCTVQFYIFLLTLISSYNVCIQNGTFLNSSLSENVVTTLGLLPWGLVKHCFLSHVFFTMPVSTLQILMALSQSETKLLVNFSTQMQKSYKTFWMYKWNFPNGSWSAVLVLKTKQNTQQTSSPLHTTISVVLYSSMYLTMFLFIMAPVSRIGWLKC